MGALVGDVMDDSPASKAGLKRGNIITEFDHKPVKDPAHLQLLVAELAPGTQVSVTVFRDKQTKSLSVTLGELPKDITDRGVTGETTGNHALAGVTVESLSGEELHRRQIESGVVVRRIDPRSPARQAGLQEGDIIREIKRKPLKTIIDFEEITRNLGPTDGVLLLITRRQATIFLMISPQ